MMAQRASGAGARGPAPGGQSLVSGQDADLASLKLIVEGKQTMTIYKPIQPLAYGAVDAAVKLARGESLSTTETIDNGFKKVPAILLEPGPVDRNNLVSTIVKDGYHSLAEICAGLPPEKCRKNSPEEMSKVQRPMSKSAFRTLNL